MNLKPLKMSHPLVIANWKMNLPSKGISEWVLDEMISSNEEKEFEEKNFFF